jgi:hypothetical protein
MVGLALSSFLSTIRMVVELTQTRFTGGARRAEQARQPALVMFRNELSRSGWRSAAVVMVVVVVVGPGRRLAGCLGGACEARHGGGRGERRAGPSEDYMRRPAPHSCPQGDGNGQSMSDLRIWLPEPTRRWVPLVRLRDQEYSAGDVVWTVVRSGRVSLVLQMKRRGRGGQLVADVFFGDLPVAEIVPRSRGRVVRSLQQPAEQALEGQPQGRRPGREEPEGLAASEGGGTGSALPPPLAPPLRPPPLQLLAATAAAARAEDQMHETQERGCRAEPMVEGDGSLPTQQPLQQETQRGPHEGMQVQIKLEVEAPQQQRGPPVEDQAPQQQHLLDVDLQGPQPLAAQLGPPPQQACPLKVERPSPAAAAASTIAASPQVAVRMAALRAAQRIRQCEDLSFLAQDEAGRVRGG